MTIQKLGASAWLAFAEGKQADALAAMREAADREDRTEKPRVTPGRWRRRANCSARCCCELKQPKAALVEFQKTMAKEPNRFRALAGAAAAAGQAGDRALARKLHAQLLAVCPRGDAPGRPELEAARGVNP